MQQVLHNSHSLVDPIQVVARGHLGPVPADSRLRLRSRVPQSLAAIIYATESAFLEGKGPAYPEGATAVSVASLGLEMFHRVALAGLSGGIERRSGHLPALNSSFAWGRQESWFSKTPRCCELARPSHLSLGGMLLLRYHSAID